MKNRRNARIIAIILAAVMLFAVIYGAVSTLTASAAVTQAQINKLKEAKSELNKKKQEVQSRINTIEYEQMSALAKKSVLDDRISLTEMEIEHSGELIEQYMVLISEKEVEVVDAQRREDEQLALYKTRIRNMEENGVISYISVVFDANSFSDLLARIDFVSDIMRSDENRYKQLTAAKLETIAAKESLEEAVKEQEAEIALLEQKYEELAEQLEQSMELIEQIEASLETEQALYEEMSAEEDRIQKDINDKVEQLRRQEEARIAAGNAGSGGAKGTGTLIWPAPASKVVTSQFGTRLHPIFNVYRSHTGIDIGAGYGTKIIAADSGTVITSAYNSAYGHYVVLNHGSMTTLYAHMSTRKVKVGDSVSKGDTIGLIGSTGNSTGPHLHFEVSVGGSRVNPLQYFSGYVIND